jgi:hypothetical protein
MEVVLLIFHVYKGLQDLLHFLLFGPFIVRWWLEDALCDLADLTLTLRLEGLQVGLIANSLIS